VTKYLDLLIAVIVGCLLIASFPVQALPFYTRTPRVEDNWPDGIWIFSPTNTTYASDTLLLNVTSKRVGGFSPAYYSSHLKYSLNGAENVTIPTADTFVDMSIPDTTFSWLASYTLISGTIALPELQEGNYELTVYGEYNRAEGVDLKYPNMEDIQTIYFTINDGIPPSITLLQFENQTYEKDNFPVNFAVNKSVSWMGYSLDGQDNVTVSGNFTLANLVYGTHNISVYAKDALGNLGSSETTSFTVAKPEQNEPWYLKALAITVAIVFIVATTLYYTRAFRTKKGQSPAIKICKC
jgi:hypothetical protein